MSEWKADKPYMDEEVECCDIDTVDAEGRPRQVAVVYGPGCGARMAACWNACSTIKNPAAIPNLIDVARIASEAQPEYLGLAEALSALDAEPGKEESDEQAG